LSKDEFQVPELGFKLKDLWVSFLFGRRQDFDGKNVVCRSIGSSFGWAWQ
jgi:hypothetical protein